MTVEKLAENFHSHASAYGLVKDRFGPRPLPPRVGYYTPTIFVGNGDSRIFLKIFPCVPREHITARSRASHPVRRSSAGQWRRPGSNRQPPACKADALPVELRPRDPLRGKPENSNFETRNNRAASGRYFGFRASCFEFPLAISQRQWARVDSDYRPHAYQACALTN